MIEPHHMTWVDAERLRRGLDNHAGPEERSITPT